MPEGYNWKQNTQVTRGGGTQARHLARGLGGGWQLVLATEGPTGRGQHQSLILRPSFAST